MPHRLERACYAVARADGRDSPARCTIKSGAPYKCGARSSMVRDDPKGRPIRPCVQVARAAARTSHTRGKAGDRVAGAQAGEQFRRRHDRVMVARFAPAPHIDALADEVGEDGWSGFRSAAHDVSIEHNRNICMKLAWINRGQNWINGNRLGIKTSRAPRMGMASNPTLHCRPATAKIIRQRGFRARHRSANSRKFPTSPYWAESEKKI